MNESLLDLLKDLIATANGQVRVVGSIIMCYVIWKFYEGPVREMHDFDYLTLIGGFALVVLSVVLDVWRRVKTPPKRNKTGRKEDKKK